MNAHDYLDAIEREAAALVDAAAACGPDTPVPSCPAWTVADLLEHIGRVHRWAVANSLRSPDAQPLRSRDVDIQVPDGHRARCAWVREGAVELVRALDRPPETPAWTFVPPATVGFWQRRQAHETAVHRWDAQRAVGEPEPIDAGLAVDGIDEVLWMIPIRPVGKKPTGSGETVHFHCTDREGEWLARLTPAGVEVERGHAKADVAARGPASDLLLLWGRVEPDALDVVGDRAMLARFQDDVRV